MIKPFNLDCDCPVKESTDYNEETWQHPTYCNAYLKDIKGKINELIDKANEK